ncbi:hypothetical protein, partial [Paraburkholderia podalyriae]|uniref:hypothetical protein n=1 Tax=Paraburkholderia podalyriae TaxID=1938811 RepID=UPI001CA3A4CC
SFKLLLKPRPIFYLSSPGHSSRAFIVMQARLPGFAKEVGNHKGSYRFTTPHVCGDQHGDERRRVSHVGLAHSIYV